MNRTDAFSYHCPRWDELPTLALYMDQVLIIIDEAARPLMREGEISATATMINNYVKIKLIAASEKKKYSRDHIARLIMVTLLKRVLSMTELDLLLRFEDTAGVYDMFCESLERRLKEVFSDGEDSAGEAAASPLIEAAVNTLVCKLRFEAIAAQMDAEKAEKGSEQ